MVASLLLLLTACSPVRIVGTEGDTNFRLSNYSTFGFHETEGAAESLGQEYLDRLALIKQEVAAQLQNRGLAMATTEPDLLVNLGVVVNEQVQTRETDFRTDRPRYIGQRRYSWRSEEVEVGRYNEGTLSMHLVDRRRNEMVWQGAAESVMPKSERKIQNRIREGVEQLVGRVPQ